MSGEVLVRAALCAWVLLEVGLQVREGDPVFRRNTHHQQTLVLCVALSAVAGSLLAHGPYPMPGSPADYQWPAGLLILGGILLRLWSVMVLGRFFRLEVVVQEGHRVVQSGPYRWIRHPSYTGFLIGALGFGLSKANWASLLAVILFNAIGFHYRIRAEEKALQEGLGDDYRRYMQHTWRVFPGLY